MSLSMDLRDTSIDCLVDDNNRLFVLEIIVHSSDISNPYKSFSICSKWADLVVEEFCLQGLLLFCYFRHLFCQLFFKSFNQSFLNHTINLSLIELIIRLIYYSINA